MTRKEFQQAIKAIGMTIPQFAEHTGLAVSSVYHWDDASRPVPRWAAMLVAAWADNRRLAADIQRLEQKAMAEYTL